MHPFQPIAPSRRQAPLRLALAGVSHDHVAILSDISPSDFTLVAICEPDAVLRGTFGAQHRLSPEQLFDDLQHMLEVAKPDVVAGFGPIRKHLEIVEQCAPRGVHVMVEKPMAVSSSHAMRMAELAQRSGILLLTNYETTWYASTPFVLSHVDDNAAIGPVRKVLVRDGHGGPIEGGCRPDFLSWLTDPSLSGGGALNDFGCYGANLLTRMMRGRLPQSVTAVSRQFKPELYPRVEDDALIVLSYPEVEAVIEASWNWPFARKDIEVYGEDGYVIADDALTVRFRRPTDAGERTVTLDRLPRNQAEPFAHMAAILRGETILEKDDLSGLSNNIAVVQILDAARRSAELGRTVPLLVVRDEVSARLPG